MVQSVTALLGPMCSIQNMQQAQSLAIHHIRPGSCTLLSHDAARQNITLARYHGCGAQPVLRTQSLAVSTPTPGPIMALPDTMTQPVSYVQSSAVSITTPGPMLEPIYITLAFPDTTTRPGSVARSSCSVNNNPRPISSLAQHNDTACAVHSKLCCLNNNAGPHISLPTHHDTAHLCCKVQLQCQQYDGGPGPKLWPSTKTQHCSKIQSCAASTEIPGPMLALPDNTTRPGSVARSSCSVPPLAEHCLATICCLPPSTLLLK